MRKICFLFFAFAFLHTLPAAGQPVVVVDPAHGGNDGGVVINEKLKEKDINLKISLLLKRELEKSGRVRVVLTRDRDIDRQIGERRKVIEDSHPAVVVSIHINRAFGRAAKGFELYYQGFKSKDKGKKKGPEAQHIIQSMQKTEYLNKSVLLSQKIQRHLGQVFPKEYRGLREAPIELIDSLAVPAVIVEIGFASNPENLKKITDSKRQEEIARALSRGILESLEKR